MNTRPHLDLSKAGCPGRVRMDESRQEAQGRKSLLQLKSKVRIGCWNVRTLYQAGKLAQLAKEMRRYKLSIIGVCESRWNTFGKVTTSSGETYLYSGNAREEDAHTHGVGMLLLKMQQKVSSNGNQSRRESLQPGLHQKVGTSPLYIAMRQPTLLNLKRKIHSTNIYKQSSKNY